MSSPQYSFLSSSGVKEVAAYGGQVDELVPPVVAQALGASPSGRAAPTQRQE